MIDLHIHIVPNYDDGARNIDESLAMLKMCAEQGVTDIFCTSHNGYSLEDRDRYVRSFNELKKRARIAGISIRLHKGCEVLCAGDYIDDIIYGLEIGAFPTLGNSKYVLTELYPDTKPSEALLIIKALREHGYNPIIAHMERNSNITGLMVNLLIQSGALIQINACSFTEESHSDIRERARELLRNGYVHFIGSDAHRIDHRPPKFNEGVSYIYNTVDKEIADTICFGNALRLTADNID